MPRPYGPIRERLLKKPLYPRGSETTNRAPTVPSTTATTPGVTYLSGYAENEEEVWSHFDQVVCLLVDDDTLPHRLAMRETNAFGKQRDELAIAIARNRAMEAEYTRKGAANVDARQPVEEVVRAVLAAGEPAG
jgi:hypothetical protein